MLLLISIVILTFLIMKKQLSKSRKIEREHQNNSQDNQVFSSDQPGNILGGERGQTHLKRFRERYSNRKPSQDIDDSKYHRFFTNNQCDKCNAESHFTAYRENKYLYFCGHHSKRYGEGLFSHGFMLIPSSPTELAAG